MKVGDYVRTSDGIAKIEKIRNGVIILDVELDLTAEGFGNQSLKEDIIKSSPNIIDLIEVGDYANGYKVLFVGATTWDNDGNVIDKRVKINYDGYDRWLSEDFIKSIVTKEQFENMKYKVED